MVLNFELSKKRFVKISFKEMKKFSEDLATEILKRYGAPDIIVYAQRGGMLIARLLSDALDVRDMVCVSARYYSKSNTRYASVKTGNVPRLDAKGYVLVVDDIADTGKTLKKICGDIRSKSMVRVVTCTFGMKPQSVIKPDFCAFRVSNDTWAIFEYEEFETTRNFSQTGNEAGLRFIKQNF
jgi:hypoxanthine phosphoribosyltransferase